MNWGSSYFRVVPIYGIRDLILHFGFYDTYNAHGNCQKEALDEEGSKAAESTPHADTSTAAGD